MFSSSDEMLGHASPETTLKYTHLAGRGDLAALAGETSRQASMLALDETFFLSARKGLAALPLVLLLRLPALERRRRERTSRATGEAIWYKWRPERAAPAR